jgi:hypothetical protein
MVPKEVTVLGRLQRARDDARARDGGRSRLSDPVPRRVGPRGASGRVGAHHHAAWIRFATIGDPERGFVQFGTETWCYVRRAPHAGFALAGPRERAGLVIDHMEQVLLAAEESRSRQEGPRWTEAAATAPRSTPRSHPDLEHPAPDPLVIDVAAPVLARAPRTPTRSTRPSRPTSPRRSPARSRTGSTNQSGKTPSPNARPTRSPSSSATSTDSRSRGSSAGCFRGERTRPMVRRHPGDRRA